VVSLFSFINSSPYAWQESELECAQVTVCELHDTPIYGQRRFLPLAWLGVPVPSTGFLFEALFRQPDSVFISVWLASLVCKESFKAFNG
jgi:hypothetical protein